MSSIQQQQQQHKSFAQSKSSGTSEWEQYILEVKKHISEQSQTNVGYFSKTIEQRCYEQCCSCPINTPILEQMALLRLPLRINLIRNDYIGCSPNLHGSLNDHESCHYNSNTVQEIVNEMNERYWVPRARIQFELVHVVERCLGREQMSIEEQKEIREFLQCKFQRAKNKDIRNQHRSIFVSQIFPIFGYNVNHLTTSANKNNNDLRYSTMKKNDAHKYYDIWFFDMIGNTLQGQCIDRKSHTIIMGERSTKGYDTATLRPHSCLAKTMAHELGHALGLGHPKNKVFDDGQSQIITTHRVINKTTTTTTAATAGSTALKKGEEIIKKVKNLMVGGVDRCGGGGTFLEQWQICVSRTFANDFLSKQ